MSPVKKAILLIFVSGLLVCTQAGYNAGEKFYFNHAVKLGFYNNNDTQRFNSIVATGLRECLDMCRRIRGCSFINYFRKLKLCDMITTQNPATRETVVQPGVVYANKSEWDIKTIPTECQSCAMNEECITEPASNHSCINNGCGHPEKLENAKLYGNMYHIGNTVMYTCNNSDSYTMNVCQQDGQWSSSNFSCEVTVTACSQAPDVVYQIETLSNGDSFSYHISTAEMTKEEGESYCESSCGQLVEVYTMEKFEFLVNTLKSNTDYKHDDFYVDGVFDSSSQKWYTNNGIVISTSLQLWESSAGYDGSSPCLCMEANDFWLDDIGCSISFRIICERK